MGLPVGREKASTHFAPPLKVRSLIGTLVQRKGENSMKTFISILAVTLALAFAGPAFAQDVKTATNAADCAKAGGIWDAATNTCSAKKM